MTHFYTILKFKDMLQGRRKKKRGLELLEISSQQKRLTLIFTGKKHGLLCKCWVKKWAKKMVK